MLNISKKPVFSEYKRIFLKKKSGRLRSVSGNLEKIVFFNSGNIVKADSNSFDEKLGVILNLLSIISDSHYDYVSGLIYSRSDELEKILLSEHFVTKSDLKKAKEYRMRRIAVTSFSMVGGSWEFEEDDLSEIGSEDISIPVQNVIYEGGKREEVRDYFMKKYAFYSPEIAIGSFESRKLLSLDELELYNFLDKNVGLSNREIVSKGNISPDQYWRIMSVLVLLDLVKFGSKKNRDVIEDDVLALLNLKRCIEEKSPELNKVLGITENDPLSMIKEKFKLAIEKFDPKHFGSALAPEIKKTAEFVMENLRNLQKEITVISDKKEQNGKFENVVEEKVKPGLKRSEVLLNSAQLYDRGHYDEAIPALKDMLRVKKNDFDVMLLLGKCQLNVQFFTDEALRNLSRAIEINPSSCEAVFFLGELFKKTKRIKKAIKCYSRVLELQPDHFLAKLEIKKINSRNIKKKKKLFFRK